jgi:two-component system, cell cycle sensor histidine kinase and response regulator CckA
VPSASDSLYAQTLSASGIGSFAWDLGRGTIRCNEVLASIVGIEAPGGHCLGTTLRQTVVVEDLPALDRLLDEARTSGQAIHHSFRVRHPASGAIRRVALRARHFGEAQVGDDILIGLLADVTVRDELNESLRISEQRHRLIFEHNPVPMFNISATTGRFTMVNLAASHLLGWTVPELELMTPTDVLMPEARPVADAILASSDRGLQRIGLVRVRRRDGVVRHLDLTIDRTTLGDEEVILASAPDVSDRISAEQALRQSEKIFRDGFETAATPTAMLDGDGIYTRVNAAFCRLFRLQPHEIEGRSFLSLTHPDDRARDANVLTAMQEGRQRAVEIEKRYLRPDGTLIRARTSATPIAHEDGQLSLLIVEVIDHTELGETIAALQKQRAAIARQAALLDTVLSNIPVMIYIVAPDQRIEYVNREWSATLGWRLEELDGIDVMEDLYPDAAYRARVREAIAEGHPGWSDSTLHTRDGRQLVTTWSTVRLDDGRIIGIGQDVTGTRAAEAERNRLELQLQQSQKLESLGVLAGGIAHDFNNLLVGVLGNASLAEEILPTDSPAAPLVAEVRTIATRAADLTRQLLAYAGKGRFVVETVDLSALVGELATLLRSVVSKRAEFEIDLTPGLPAVKADATQLRQVVMNLITNASDALDDRPGRISLRTGVMEPDEEFRMEAVGGASLGEGPHLFVEVQDTGHGMTAETLARIFDPFFTSKFAGRGLGLAATLGIVRSHGGAIHVCSSFGVGTTIRLALPAEQVEIPAAPPRRESQPDWRGSGDVLLADDEDLVRRVAARVLQRLGFSVVECADGQEAVERFAEEPDRYRLVILDLTMPRRSGDDALRAIRRIRADVPVVLCSGHTAEGIDPSLTALPGVSFLQKPYEVTALGITIREALGALT